MDNDDDDDEASPAVASPKAILEKARSSLTQLGVGKDWAYWIDVGRGLEECRRQALVAAKANSMVSGKARRAMTAILETEGLSGIDKGNRSLMLSVMDELPAVTKWRDALTRTEKLNLNHPKTVLARWKKAKVPPPAPDGGNGATAPARRNYRALYQGAKAEVVHLNEQLAAKRTLDSKINVEFDDPETIAKALFGGVDLKRAKDILFAGLGLVKEAERRSGNPPKADPEADPLDAAAEAERLADPAKAEADPEDEDQDQDGDHNDADPDDEDDPPKAAKRKAPQS